MRVYQFMDDGGLLLISVTPEYVEMLRRLPAIAHGDGAERFRAPDPMDPENRSPEARDLRDDWVDLVIPDLHEAFDNQHSAVSEVLDKAEPSGFDDWLLFHQKLAKSDAGISEGEGGGDDGNSKSSEETVDLTIPPQFVELWYGALNQGRLALHARYGKSEGEFTNSDDISKSDGWIHARNHYLFYSFLQVPLMQLMQMEFQEDLDESQEQQLDDNFDNEPPF